MITLKFFASLREALQTADEGLELPHAVGTVGELRRHLAARGGDWERLTTARNLRCAVNQAIADDAASIRDGDEVAFFPPVTGG
jgi:molybdopterin synthase sulfur carrier subunit